MTAIHFLVTSNPDGGYSARATSADIFTDADDVETLRLQVRDAVNCHYEDGGAPTEIVLLDATAD